MNYIYYQTKTKFTNTGDALINKTLLQLLRNYGSLRCNCSKEIPERFIEELGIKEEEKVKTATEFGFVMSIFKSALTGKFKGNKTYIVSGLGHNWGGSFKKCVRNLLASALFPFYRLCGVKIVKIGMSIGPISKGLGVTEKIKSLFINYYYVRDTKSLNLCHDIGIKKAKLCPDLSWSYLSDKKKEINKNNIITIGLKESILNEKDPEYIELMLTRLEQILSSFKQPVKLIFIYQVIEDKDITFNAYNRLKDKYDSSIVEEQLNLNSALRYYGQACYNISNRMHSLLLGYKYGALPLALIDVKHHVKISQTFIDNNLEDLLIDIYTDLKEKINDIEKNKVQLFNQIASVEKNMTVEIKNVLNDTFCIQKNKDGEKI